MKNVFVVGGLGFAHECAMFLMDIAKKDDSIKFAGFLGHNGFGKQENYKSLQEYYRGDVADYAFSDDDYVVIGGGYPRLRELIYLDCKKLNLKFYTLICPNSSLDPSVELGEANIFISSSVSTHCKIGNGNLFNVDVKIGHDITIGDFNFFAPRSMLLGQCDVGSYNSIGANSLLLPKVKMGDNNKIAPLSAVYKRVKSNSYYLGNPAVKVGEVADE